MSQKIVIVASDYLQSEVATRLNAGLVSVGFDAILLVGNGQNKFPPTTDDILVKEIPSAAAVVVTVSDRFEKEVGAAELALKAGVPLVISSDGGYGGWRKKEFRTILTSSAALFVVDEMEATAVRSEYPSVNVVATSCPKWEDFATTRFTREEIRQYLRINSDERLILIVGEKTPVLNLPLAVAVCEAVTGSLLAEHKFRIVMALHPGDLSPEGVYEDLPKYAPGLPLEVRRRPSPPPADWIGTGDLLPGVDVVVATNSTVLIQAATLGIPSIACMLRGAFRGRKLSTDDDDIAVWWPPAAREGAIEPVFGLDSDEVAELVHGMVINPPIPNWRRDAQKKYFPASTEKGRSVGLMVAAIQDVIRKAKPSA